MRPFLMILICSFGLMSCGRVTEAQAQVWEQSVAAIEASLPAAREAAATAAAVAEAVGHPDAIAAAQQALAYVEALESELERLDAIAPTPGQSWLGWIGGAAATVGMMLLGRYVPGSERLAVALMARKQERRALAYQLADDVAQAAIDRFRPSAPAEDHA